MEVSDIIIYIMKIMWRDLKKIRWSRLRDIQKSAKSPILNEVALIQVVRKRVSFKIARTKINQNFQALKYDIKQHSEAT